MAGGGSQTSTSNPQLPPELRRVFGSTADEVQGVFDNYNLTDAFGIGPRQVAGADPLESAAYDQVGQFFEPTQSAQAAFQGAAALAQPSQYRGVDLSGIGSSADYGVGGGSAGGPGGAMPREAQASNQDRIDSAIENIDFANHPALRSAMATFEQAALPGIANQMGAAGLSRSGAAGSAITQGKAQMAMPIMQQLISSSVQERQQDIGQREQDQQFDLGQRGQDVTQRGQDLNQLLQNAGLGLQARGQDINALLQQGSQGLQARGQDINSLIAGTQSFNQRDAQDLARLQGGMGAAAQMGGLMRGIEQEGLNALYDAAIRDSDLLAQIGLAPLGGLTSQIGTRTTTSGGGK